MANYNFEEISSKNEQEALNVYLNNEAYFALTGNTVSIESLRNDRSARPDIVTKEQKRFCIVRRENESVGVIDYLFGYPSEKSVYIGLLLVKERGKGYGREIVDYLSEESLKKNFTLIALSVLDNNEGAQLFWEKVGFKKVSKTVTELLGKEVSVYYYEKSLKE